MQKLALLCCLPVLCMLWASCGGTHTTNVQQSNVAAASYTVGTPILYIDGTPDSQGNQLYAYLIRPDGSLSFLQGVNSLAAAVSSGQFIYTVAQAQGNNLNAYGWQPRADGTLVPVPGSPFSVMGGGDTQVLCGKYYYVSIPFNWGALYGYNIAANGALSPIPGSPNDSGSRVYMPFSDPSCQHLFLPVAAEYQVFAIDPATGMLTLLSNTPGSHLPSTSVTDDSGKYLYNFTLSDQGSLIYVYQITSNGTLTQIPGSPFTVPAVVEVDAAYSIATPTGNYI